ncbi:unnamed protein product [Tenebrio molitor]|nr:unnamed protein product [Tenebrio molitor]
MTRHCLNMFILTHSSFASKIGFGGPGHPQLIHGPFASCKDAALHLQRSLSIFRTLVDSID